MYKLVISDDEGKTTVVPLVRDEITIGRKEGNTIRLTERNVSRRHARLRKMNGSFFIDDLGSYNGVKINGRRIDAESELQSGDQVTIGDYMIAIQTEAATSTSDAPPAPAPAAAPAPPARLVMLTPPTPGAEFSLRDGMRIGRAEDLDIWVNHRSISREHAVVRVEGEMLKVVDLDSANGLRLNGEDVHEVVLNSGDVIELGQVRFRYVAKGEHFVFDVDQTVQMEALAEAPSRTPMIAAAAIVLVAIIAGAAIALSGGESGETVEIIPVPSETELVEALEPVADPSDATSANIERCRASLETLSWDDAIRAAEAALATAPDHEGAHTCKLEAQTGQREQEMFEAAVGSFRRRDFDGAFAELSNLAADSAYRGRSEAQEINESYVEYHLALSESASTSDERVMHAQAVLDCECGTAGDVAQAQRLLRRAGRSTSSSASSRRPRTSRSGSRGTSRHTSAPIVMTKIEPTPPPTPPAMAPSQNPASRRSVVDVSRECGLGNNRCLVRELAELPRSPRRDQLMIQGYLDLRQTVTAEGLMREFVQRYPDHRATRRYRQRLNN